METGVARKPRPNVLGVYFQPRVTIPLWLTKTSIRTSALQLPLYRATMKVKAASEFLKIFHVF